MADRLYHDISVFQKLYVISRISIVVEFTHGILCEIYHSFDNASHVIHHTK